MALFSLYNKRILLVSVLLRAELRIFANMQRIFCEDTRTLRPENASLRERAVEDASPYTIFGKLKS